MQQGQPPSECGLVSGLKIQPGQHEHRAGRQRPDPQRSRDHQGLGIGDLVQGVQSIRLNLKHWQRGRGPRFDKDDVAVVKGHAPGLMDASTSNRSHAGNAAPGERSIHRHQISPERVLHHTASCQLSA